MTIIIFICNCQKNLSCYISLDTPEDEIRKKEEQYKTTSGIDK